MVLCIFGDMKEMWCSPKSPLCVVSIVWKMKKKRVNKNDEDDEWKEKLHPNSWHIEGVGGELRFFLLSFVVWVRFRICFFFAIGFGF